MIHEQFQDHLDVGVLSLYLNNLNNQIIRQYQYLHLSKPFINFSILPY